MHENFRPICTCVAFDLSGCVFKTHSIKRYDFDCCIDITYLKGICCFPETCNKEGHGQSGFVR